MQKEQLRVIHKMVMILMRSLKQIIPRSIESSWAINRLSEPGLLPKPSTLHANFSKPSFTSSSSTFSPAPSRTSFYCALEKTNKQCTWPDSTVSMGSIARCISIMCFGFAVRALLQLNFGLIWTVFQPFSVTQCCFCFWLGLSSLLTSMLRKTSNADSHKVLKSPSTDLQIRPKLISEPNAYKSKNLAPSKRLSSRYIRTQGTTTTSSSTR